MSKNCDSAAQHYLMASCSCGYSRPTSFAAASRSFWMTVLGKRVRVHDGQRSSVRAEGEVVAVIEAPTLVIRQDDGTIAYESSDLPVEYAYVEWRPL